MFHGKNQAYWGIRKFVLDTLGPLYGCLCQNDLFFSAPHSGDTSTLKFVGKSQVFLYSKARIQRKNWAPKQMSFGGYFHECPKDEPSIAISRRPL